MNAHADETLPGNEPLAALRRFARTRAPMERCELCSAALQPEHAHLLQKDSRQIACACDACAVLFCGQEGSKYLRVPRRIHQLQDFVFTDMEWEAMMLPINLAFFLRDADGEIAALYPSPAGAVASQLGMHVLAQRFVEHKLLRSMEPEVEALLVNRGADGGCFLVPVDVCYQLVGLMRTKWRGLSGGADLWAAIAHFFSELKQRTSVQVQHA